ncbi:uncharacterized protein CTRU02_212126 [Colletotrichum truncatum]|uniref:Uncharacterized protein n=1 Tax=Colletotrichum truncatum TaxID=5467 RepID=A0ACC3YMP5_COLTU|nr:uncharacterized protein CTRU02_06803 [Colletotrichum truncatum]KAF6792186.1 hypothetical protein CTRU02_06803 [Colletotrichum truncatum]
MHGCTLIRNTSFTILSNRSPPLGQHAGCWSVYLRTAHHAR